MRHHNHGYDKNLLPTKYSTRVISSTRDIKYMVQLARETTLTYLHILQRTSPYKKVPLSQRQKGKYFLFKLFCHLFDWQGRIYDLEMKLTNHFLVFSQ